MTQGDKRSHLGEAVNDGQDDRLPTNPREPFHKVHGDVAPNLRWHQQGLEKTSRVEMFSLIALTHSAAMNEGADQLMKPAVVEGRPQPVEGFLDTLMTSLMSITEELWPQTGALRNEDTAVVEQ